MKNYIMEAWLEAEVPGMGQPLGNQAGGTVDPSIGNTGPQPTEAPTEPPVEPSMEQEPEDISGDPQIPDMPQEKERVEDFEVWKNEYLRESIKGDAAKLIDLLHKVRHNDSLAASQSKFIDDNLNIQMARENSDIARASKDIRKNIKEQLDRNNPATTVVNHMSGVLATIPALNNIFIKLRGYNAIKGELNRKFIASLIGGVQVGSDSDKPDIIYNDKEYAIELSTRCNAEWGDVVLGHWTMLEDDAERFLSSSEIKRMSEGSPEEKDAMRKRLVIESMAQKFETRAFVVTVVTNDGTIYLLGWDISGSLKAAYSEGKIKVKLRASDNSEAFFTDEGKLMAYQDLDVVYTKETGKQNDDGSPEVEELPFIDKINNQLILKADLQTIRDASNSMQGISLKEVPYNGNPSDLQVLTRCVFSFHDLIMRKCQ